MTLFENTEHKEKAILVSVDTGDFDAEVSIDELEELVNTADAQVFAKIIQKRENPDSALYVGAGKLKEIKEICGYNDINLLVFDCELTPSQLRNIENFTDIRVVDRTTLILDIFAKHAKSKEGKLQVKLAQLKYSLPRLTGKGVTLSRLGGGIGTRGPGETKLESDKRHIRRSINAITNELKEVEKRRKGIRFRRKKNGVESIVVVGYTNAGKSTLMNQLTNAGVLSENKLFATLDPTARSLTIPDGREVVLIDTVGFVRRLPHNLVEAFKSTLEEVSMADVILNVCDVSNPQCEEHLSVTNKLLNELGASSTPTISVMNKCDLLEFDEIPVIGKCVMISALNGKGIDSLLNEIQSSLPKTRKRVQLLLPFDKISLCSKIRENGIIHSEEYLENGLCLDATVDINQINLLKDYVI